MTDAALTTSDVSNGTDRGQSLRVGVLIDSLNPPAWIAILIEQLRAHPQLEPRVILGAAANGARPASKPPTSHRVRADSPRLIGELVRSRLIDTAGGRSTAGVSRSLPTDLSITSLEEFAASSVTIDVLLDTGLRDVALENRLTGTPIWSVDVEGIDARVEQALLNRSPVLWVHLWRAECGSPESAFKRLASHALPLQTFSLTWLSDATCFALPALLTGRLNWLAQGLDPLAVEEASLPPRDASNDTGEESLFRREQSTAEASAIRAQTDAPTASSTVQLFQALRLLFRRLRRGVENKLSEENWQLAVTTAAETDTTDSVLARIRQVTLERWSDVGTPDDCLWADPHLCRHEGKNYVFLEEVAPNDSHGHVTLLQLDDSGALVGEPSRVLSEPFHLSYPFVLEHEGAHWMMPETATRGTVSLYKATRFPDAWEHACDLLVDVDLADSTLHHRDGRWWLFTNRFSTDAINERDELLIFYADALEGPWLPHALNPVVTGVDRARMAGPLFQEGGQDYRPSQYGGIRYGHGVNIARIDTLTPEHYRETPVAQLRPSPGSRWLGCHSLATAGHLTIVDRFTRRWRW